MLESRIRLAGRSVVLLTWGAAALALYGILTADPSGDPDGSLDRRTPALRPAPPPQVPDLAALGPLVDRPLRRPLYDPPPTPEPEPKPEPQPTPPPPVRIAHRLIGTVIEDGRSRAVLVSPDGRLEIRGVGDTLPAQPVEVYVKEVRDDSVIFGVESRPGTVVTLSLEQRRSP